VEPQACFSLIFADTMTVASLCSRGHWSLSLSSLRRSRVYLQLQWQLPHFAVGVIEVFHYRHYVGESCTAYQVSWLPVGYGLDCLGIVVQFLVRTEVSSLLQNDQTRSTSYPTSYSVESSFILSFIYLLFNFLLYNYLLCSVIAVISYAVFERM